MVPARRDGGKDDADRIAKGAGRRAATGRVQKAQDALN
jgi:hypothetical protein